MKQRDAIEYESVQYLQAMATRAFGEGCKILSSKVVARYFLKMERCVSLFRSDKREFNGFAGRKAN